MGDYEADAPRPKGSDQPNRGPDIERLPERPYFDHELGTEVFPNDHWCPRPWTGDDGTSAQCIANDHCGCAIAVQIRALAPSRRKGVWRVSTRW